MLPTFRLILTDADTLTTAQYYTVHELQEKLDLSLWIFLDLLRLTAVEIHKWVVWRSLV